MAEKVVIADDVRDLHIADLTTADVRRRIIDIDESVDLRSLRPGPALQQQVRRQVMRKPSLVAYAAHDM